MKHFLASMLLACGILTIPLSCFAADSIHPIINRINNHLLIGDSASALQEAAAELRENSSSSELHCAYIRAAAAAGDERLICSAWRTYSDQFPDEALQKQEVQEAMAWGIIDSGLRSTSPIIRLTAVLAAFFGEDARSIPRLLLASHDCNVAVRSIAVKLMGHLRDAPLCDRVEQLFVSETSWPVRLELIEALGSMKILKARRELALILTSTQCSAEEKAAAFAALVDMLEDISREELECLVSSDRATLRQLACKVIGHLHSERDGDLLLQLVNDNNGAVRAAALRALGLLECFHNPEVTELARRSCRDPIADVAITASWLLALCEPESAPNAFSSWLNHPHPERCRQAAAALAATGEKALKKSLLLIKKLSQISKDSFVKVNLAIGLIQNRIDVDYACEQLYSEMRSNNRHWMWDEIGGFSSVIPASLKDCEGADASPEALNQLTRLELLNILSIVKFPKAQEAVEEFLQQRKWGVTGIATTLLLTEGNESALQLVENILNQPDSPIKVQAALILALWGRDEKAIAILENGYQKGDREMKEKILEGIARIGARQSIPFLIKRFEEPQQSLRLIAAAALLQCLYH